MAHGCHMAKFGFPRTSHILYPLYQLLNGSHGLRLPKSKDIEVLPDQLYGIVKDCQLHALILNTRLRNAALSQ